MRKSIFLHASAAAVTVFFAAAPAHAALRIVLDRVINMNRPAGSCAAFNQNLINDPNLDIVCMVSGTGGNFQGGGEFGTTFRDATRTWVFRGGSCQPGIFFHITCIQNQ